MEHWVHFFATEELIEQARFEDIASLGVTNDDCEWVDRSIVPVAAFGHRDHAPDLDNSLGFLLYDSGRQVVLFGGIHKGYSRDHVLRGLSQIGLPDLPPLAPAHLGGPDADPGGWRIVTGVVCGGPPTPVVSVAIDTDGRDGGVRHASAFAVRAGDDEIAVEPGADCQLLPTLRESGPYGSLAGPLARACRAAAPGDHIEVRLSGNVVAAGQQVAVLGPVVEGLEAGDGYRGATRSVVKSIQARAIGVGADARAEVDRWWCERVERLDQHRVQHAAWIARDDERKRRERFAAAEAARRRVHPGELRLWPVSLPLVVAAGLLLAAVGHAATAGAITAASRGLAAAAAGNLGFAAFVWRRRRWFPEFAPLVNGLRGRGVRWQMVASWIVWGFFAVGGLFALVDTADLTATVGVSHGLLALGCLAMIAVSDHRSVKTASHMLGAAPLSPQSPPASFGAFEGIFRGARAIVTRRDFEALTTTSYRWAKDSDGNRYQEAVNTTRYRWAESWRGDEWSRIETGVGWLHLGPSGADFASARRDVTLDGTETIGVEGNAGVTRAGFTQMFTDTGDSMLALGRLAAGQNGPYLQATGPGALTLFSSPAGTSARAVLARLRLHHRLGLAAMALAAIAAGVIGIVPIQG